MMPRTKLKNLRRSKGISPDQMAKSLNISLSHYYKIEKGKRNPSFDKAQKISEILDETVDNIFFEHQLDKSSRKQTS